MLLAGGPMKRRIADDVKVGSIEYNRLIADLQMEQELLWRSIGQKAMARSIWEMPVRYGNFAYHAPPGAFWGR